MAKIALAALPAVNLLAKPNSAFSGVQIGVILANCFRGMPGGDGADQLLKHMVEVGLSGCEMHIEPVEAFLGSPASAGRGGGRAMGAGGAAGDEVGAARGRGAAPGAAPGDGRAPGAGGAAGAGPGAARGGARAPRAPLTPEQQAAQQKAADDLKKWRLSVSMDKFKAFRKQWNDAGVRIYAAKFVLNMAMSDDEFEYAFTSTKALGGDHLTMELPTDGALTKRVGEFAAKHKMMMGYHAHTQATPTLWDEALSQSKYNGINLDIGHYLAGTSQSPMPLFQKRRDRITCLHLKDRKRDNGPNMPWGQGDTPIKEFLQLMKKEKDKFPGTIELEYAVPPGSDSATETAKCLQYCKEALA